MEQTVHAHPPGPLLPHPTRTSHHLASTFPYLLTASLLLCPSCLSSPLLRFQYGTLQFIFMERIANALGASMT